MVSALTVHFKEAPGLSGEHLVIFGNEMEWHWKAVHDSDQS